MDIKTKRQNRIRRHKRVRAVVKGTRERPRLSVFRSGNHIYAQLIDDANEITLLSASDLKEAKSKKSLAGPVRGKTPLASAGHAQRAGRTSNGAGKKASAFKVGEILAKEAKDKGIKSVIFDRGGYKYHGRVQALAEGARKGGLSF